ncbi:histidine phosphatase family protein [Gordonia sp. NPDC003376]
MTLHLITAGRSGPNKALRFGGDPSLDDVGRKSVLALAARLNARSADTGARSADTGARSMLVGPDAASRQTAELLTPALFTPALFTPALFTPGRPVSGPTLDDRLATLDVGSWSGCVPEQIDPSALGAFFTDPDSTPHGGESLAAFVARILAWRDEVSAAGADLFAVVAMPVAQAVLAGDPAGFFAVDVAPAHHYPAP